MTPQDVTRMRFGCQGPSLVVYTPAKLNLFLEILGRRPDGYHELETLMVSVGLYDTLLFTEDASHQTRLRCHRVFAKSRRHATRDERRQESPGDPELTTQQASAHHAERDGDSDERLSSGADNLVHRAADLLREATGCDRPVTIDLWKRIPMQAGLGGGSSDAAATLVGLNRFWGLGLASPELHELAARIGSDVNFFLDSPLAAACRGRGEQVTPVAVPHRLHFVIVQPDSGLSTGEVFRQWGRDSANVAPHPLDSFVDALAAGLVSAGSGVMHNALESPARALNADIARTLDTLRAAGATSTLMSGSGSACFAICRTAPHARLIAGRLKQRGFENVVAVELKA